MGACSSYMRLIDWTAKIEVNFQLKSEFHRSELASLHNQISKI